jgi:hypothetical protein
VGATGATGPAGSSGTTNANQATVATDVSTNSTALVLMPDMTITQSIASGKAFVSFSATVSHDRTQRLSEFALYVDSAKVFASGIVSQTADDQMNPSFTFLVTGLSNASHTFEIFWRISNNDGSVRQRAATWGMGRALQVMEVN